MKVKTSLSISLSLGLGFLMGCGGSSPSTQSSSEASRTATVTLTIRWPSVSRLIPLAAQSIRAEILDRAGRTVSTPRVIARPATGDISNVTFNAVPATSLTVKATSFPNADGSGVAQSAGSVVVVAKSNQVVDAQVTMDSTVDHLVISADTSALTIGKNIPATASAFDKSGALILTTPEKWQWTSSNPAVATVDAVGNGTTVHGISKGSSTIIATETESGKSISLGIDVAQVGVTIQPATADVSPKRAKQFSATVSGASNQGVTWSVEEGAAGGSIDSSGLYTAPATPGTYHVIATSQADPTRSDRAIVNVALSYQVTDLGVLRLNDSTGYAINSAGQITGTSGQFAFLWTAGSMTEIIAVPSEGTGINDAGWVSGNRYHSVDVAHPNDSAFFWKNGAVNYLPGISGCKSAETRAINNQGQVIGSCSFTSQPPRPCLWTNGVPQDLGYFDGGVAGWCFDINNRSQVVGVEVFPDDSRRGFLWENGVFRNLGTLGGKMSYAYGVNESGHVIGFSGIDSADNTSRHAFLWKDGTMRDIHTSQSYQNSTAYGVNDDGTIVGDLLDSNVAPVHAFVYQGNVMVDLNSCISSNSPWLLESARSINNNGQITGYGTINNEKHGFLLTPI